MAIIPIILSVQEQGSSLFSRFESGLARLTRMRRQSSQEPQGTQGQNRSSNRDAVWDERVKRFRDPITGRLAAAKTASDELGDSLGKVAGMRFDSMGEIAGHLRNAVFQGNLMTKAFDMAVGAVQKVVGGIQGAIEENKQLELENITTASSIAAMAGLKGAAGLKEAAGFVDKLNASLSNTAASLPGATSDYTSLARTITDNVIPAFQDAGGAVNLEGLRGGLEKISTAYGVLGAGAGIDAGATGQALSLALGGGSISALKQLQFFSNSPQIMGELERQLGAMGKELGDLDVQSRFNLLLQAAEKFVTPEFIQQASTSVSGMWEGFKSSFIDPIGGLFGMSRDLEPAIEGSQTAFQAFRRVVEASIGPNGLFSAGTELLRSLGLTFDPMKILADGFDLAAEAIKTVTGIVKIMADSASAVTMALPFDPGKGIKRIGTFFTRIQEYLSAAGDLNGLTRLLPTWGLSFDSIGEGFSSIFSDIVTWVGDRTSDLISKLPALINAGVGAITQFVKGINWQESGVAAGAAIGKVIGSAFEALSNIDTAKLLIGIGEIALGLIKFTLSLIGGLALGAREGIAAAMKNSFEKWVEAIRTFFDAIKGFVGGIIQSIPGIGPLLAGNPEVSGGSAGGARRGVPQPAYGTPTTTTERSGRPVGRMASGGLVQQAASTRRSEGGVLVQQPVAAPAMQSTGRPVGRQVGQPAIARVAGPRFAGQLPENASRLLGAAAEESRQMPSGSRLVVANTSEAILPQRAIASMGGGSSISIGNISVSSNASDPNAVADLVVRKIQEKIARAREGQLA